MPGHSLAPRVTLLVPGAATDAPLDGPFSTEWIENDGAFGAAFSFGTVDDDRRAAIDAAPGAVLVTSTVDLLESRTALVAAVEQLRDAGGLAVRIEESRLGWAIEDWLRLFSAPNPGSWHRGAVVMLSDGEAVQSCGMKAFSRPDVRVAVGSDPVAAHELGNAFNVFQLAEDPVLRSGETFGLSAGAPRRVLERWPDLGYPEDHACHNPYGVWRIGLPGGRARSLGQLELVFVPALRLLLENAAAPLDRQAVEALRDNSSCIAMEPRDGLVMERSRGFADLDPELAWEQWEALRRKRG
jgi:hypothetical protein